MTTTFDYRTIFISDVHLGFRGCRAEELAAFLKRVKCERVLHKKDLAAAMQRMLDAEEPYILDVMVPYTEHVLPMIPAGATYKDVIYEGRQTLKAGDGL